MLKEPEGERRRLTKLGLLPEWAVFAVSLLWLDSICLTLSAQKSIEYLSRVYCMSSTVPGAEGCKPRPVLLDCRGQERR